MKKYKKQSYVLNVSKKKNQFGSSQKVSKQKKPPKPTYFCSCEHVGGGGGGLRSWLSQSYNNSLLSHTHLYTGPVSYQLVCE